MSDNSSIDGQPEDERLSAMLHSWQETTELPPRFKERVWQRIGHAERRSNALGRLWRVAVQRWEALVQRPVGVAACLVLFVALGLLAGTLHARVYTAQAERSWQSAYFGSVSPTTLASVE